MKKFVPLLIVGILLISGIGTQAVNTANTEPNSGVLTEAIEIDVSTLRVIDSDTQYLTVDLGEEVEYLMNPGQPMIPRIVRSYELPFGVTNIQVEAEPLGIQEFTVVKQIEPAPAPLPLTPRSDVVTRAQKDQTVYDSHEH